jgi:hypothetical protein
VATFFLISSENPEGYPALYKLAGMNLAKEMNYSLRRRLVSVFFFFLSEFLGFFSFSDGGGQRRDEAHHHHEREGKVTQVDWQPAYAIYPSPSFSTRFDGKKFFFFQPLCSFFIFSVSSSSTARACPLFGIVYTRWMFLGREEEKKDTETFTFLGSPE